jgi:hypothetical protein
VNQYRGRPLARLLREYHEFPADGIDDVTRYQQRVLQLRPELPERGAVGYEDEFIQQEPNFRYLLTQYALAPLVLKRVEQSAGLPLLIRNRLRQFSDEPFRLTFEASHRPNRDEYRNNIWVVRREGQ